MSRGTACPFCAAPLHECEYDRHFLACAKIESVVGCGASDWTSVLKQERKAEWKRRKEIS